MTIEELLSDCVINSTVKTKNKSEKVDIVKSDALLEKLAEIKIIKSNDNKQNLCDFLCIN